MPQGSNTMRLEDAFARVEDAFSAAVSAIGDLLRVDGPEEPVRLPMLVVGSTPSDLLAAFVDDLLLLARGHRFAANKLERLELRPGSLRAAVSGWTNPARRQDLTRRRATLSRRRGRWSLTLELDFAAPDDDPSSQPG